MNDADLRAEVAAIARRVRRVVERQGAAGGGELLAGATANAARTGRVRRTGIEPAPDGEAGPAGNPGDVTAVMTAPAPAPRAAKPATPAPAASRPAAAVPAPAGDDFVFEDELPSHHPPLHPIGEARLRILGEGQPLLDAVAAEARACRACGLCETRTHAVPGVGSGATGIVFVGEAPGADEDTQGEPFVGRAGQLLTRIIAAMDEAALIPGVKLSRETVYICNVLKCRPPENRNPLPHEIEMCSPYLRRQLDALQPRIICCLGKFAAELLVGVKGTIGGLRGKLYRYQGAKLLVTYHPAACLRNPGYKRPVWEDMQLLAREYLKD